MTPKEQDKELREKLNSLFESVFSQGVRAGKDVANETYEDFDAWSKKDEIDKAMQLITADRKRVALEARLNEVQNAYEYWINGTKFISSYFRDRIAELSISKESK